MAKSAPAQSKPSIWSKRNAAAAFVMALVLGGIAAAIVRLNRNENKYCVKKPVNGKICAPDYDKASLFTLSATEAQKFKDLYFQQVTGPDQNLEEVYSDPTSSAYLVYNGSESPESKCKQGLDVIRAEGRKYSICMYYKLGTPLYVFAESGKEVDDFTTFAARDDDVVVFHSDLTGGSCSGSC